MELEISHDTSFVRIIPSGRIDSISSVDLQKELDRIAQQGSRTILVDFSRVNYISSAGLRVFLKIHGALKHAGGSLLLTSLPDPVLDVFKMGGFLKFFNIVNPDDIDTATSESTDSEIIEKNINGTQLRIKKINSEYGKFNLIGNSAKLASANYSSGDMVSVSASEISFGTGLAALGNSFEECREYFGEAVVIKNSLFFYPAVKNPGVDFMLRLDPDMDFGYSFLHGFSFTGNFSAYCSFEAQEEFIDLNSLTDSLLQTLGIDSAGIVLISESKGIWGMHLKRSPVLGNQPENGEEIFSNGNFTEWMNFPVEPGDINSVVVASGVVKTGSTNLGTNAKNVFSGESNHHLHAVLFERDLLNPDIDNFDNELTRIITTLEAGKVQHLLGKSKFSRGLIAVVPLKFD